MNDYGKLRFDDFYFNGHWLSDFEGEIGSSSSELFPFSILPEKSITTDTALGRDGELVVDVKYNPRTFTVPVIFNNLGRLREIAGWLGSKTPKDFYFKNDNVKIKCMIDSALDISRIFTRTGKVELKFIAHETYYEAINDTLHVFRSPYPTIINFHNQGNIESLPVVKIIGNGTVTLEINGKQFSVQDVTAQAFVDSMKMTCYQDGSTNKYHHFSGSFPILNPEHNTLKVVSGTPTQIEIQCRSRWI